MTLEAIDKDLWLAEGPVVDFHGFPYPTRMVVVRLPDGTLWVWSPIELTDALKSEVEALGPVAHLVSPNAIHYLFLGQWHHAWPEAKLWGPAATIKKCKDLPFEAALEDTPPEAWQGVISQAWFRGSFFMDEIAFLHEPTHTAIFADLSEHFSEGFLKRHWKGWQRWIAGLWGITEGKGHAPLEWRLSWWNREPARRAIARIIAAKPRRVIMAHGEWVDEDAGLFLRRAFSWLIKD
ncbi:DUF4336 domain-containing protein [Henriciella sp.]|uniref:DUF4336 domain-containing protein n=1 Tax=Henriciella sp. TaxID=1968823 RepID=UPI002621E4EA|nr:DUF4336 domain-containing protein [Henriciella sp.]